MSEIREKLEITTGSWVRAVAVLVGAYMIFQVHHLLLLILASVIIASAIEPLTMWARRHNMPRVLAVVLIYLFLALLLANVFYFLFLPLVGEVSSFIRTLSIYTNTPADGVLSGLFERQNIFGDLRDSVPVSEISSYLNSYTSFLSKGVFSSVSTVFGGVLSFVLTVVLSFYLAVQEDGVAKFLRLITPIRHEKYVVGLWKRSQRKIALWLQGQLVASTLVGLLVLVSLLIAGVPHALLLAFMAGLLDLIPVVGPLLASIPALFVAFIFGGPSMVFVVAGIYLVIQQLENHIIYPLVQKKLVGVPPMVSILALLVGYELAGFLGVLISVPIAAALMEFFSDFERNKLAKIEAENASS